ncbi:MAG: hypothetical protein RBU25_03385 [Lentisphaeria bacterium]|jgi:hypothetical protein|nr:hypothetical protein [Lentisphaeria bacterium]
MTRCLAFYLLSATAIFLLAAPCQAVTPEVVAGAAAAQAAPRVLSATAKELGTIPSAVGQTLSVPLGLAEIVLCPLPGPTLGHGLKNTVHGLMGPVKLVGTCVKLPFTMVGAAVGSSR